MATRAAARPARASGPLEAYVLHQYDWSESSLIVDLYTRERGRVVVAAKGAKRPNSQLRAILLPFQRLHVTLGRAPVADGDGEVAEVQNLRGAEWAGGPVIAGGAALFAGFYLNELLMKLLARGDPHVALFETYTATLAALAPRDGSDASGPASDPPSALRAFELRLLGETGVLPDLSVATLTQQPLTAERLYALAPGVGLVEAPAAARDAALTGAAWTGLQAALEHGAFEALRAACRPAAAPLKTALRASLQYHLGSATLRTREVMRGVARLNDRPRLAAAPRSLQGTDAHESADDPREP